MLRCSDAQICADCPKQGTDLFNSLEIISTEAVYHMYMVHSALYCDVLPGLMVRMETKFWRTEPGN